MFRSVLSISKPVQLLGKQLVNKQLPSFSPFLMNRFFSEGVEEAKSKEEQKENDVSEEVVAPVYHNQFSHVIMLVMYI